MNVAPHSGQKHSPDQRCWTARSPLPITSPTTSINLDEVPMRYSGRTFFQKVGVSGLFERIY
jgi:hypothetical protein